jgi:hypothetical protein
MGVGCGKETRYPLYYLIFPLIPFNASFKWPPTSGFSILFPCKGARFRTSLYADDVAIVMAPFKEDISMLAQILSNFGNATGLMTNLTRVR